MSEDTAPQASTAARRVARRLVAERGPLPDHLVRSIADRLRRARTGTDPSTNKRPA